MLHTLNNNRQIFQSAAKLQTHYKRKRTQWAVDGESFISVSRTICVSLAGDVLIAKKNKVSPLFCSYLHLQFIFAFLNKRFIK